MSTTTRLAAYLGIARGVSSYQVFRQSQKVGSLFTPDRSRNIPQFGDSVMLSNANDRFPGTRQGKLGLSTGVLWVDRRKQ